MLYELTDKPTRVMAFIRIYKGGSNFLERVKSKQVLVDIVFVSKETYEEALELGWNEDDFRKRNPDVEIYYEEGHNNKIRVIPQQSAGK